MDTYQSKNGVTSAAEQIIICRPNMPVLCDNKPKRDQKESQNFLKRKSQWITEKVALHKQTSTHAMLEIGQKYIGKEN